MSASALRRHIFEAIRDGEVEPLVEANQLLRRRFLQRGRDLHPAAARARQGRRRRAKRRAVVVTAWLLDWQMALGFYPARARAVILVDQAGVAISARVAIVFRAAIPRTCRDVSSHRWLSPQFR